MRFPPSLLDEIRARIPISEVVGRRVTWDRRKSQPSRGNYWACCPFHGEKTPSFHAEDRKGRYHCFGCGVSGDHFTFLVEQEGLSFPEAVERLAAEAGVALPERGPDAERREEARASLYDVMEMAAAFFEEALQAPEGAKARAYLRERSIAPEMQRRFRIGYAPAARSALKQRLADRGIAQEAMVEAGLLVAGDDIPVSYDRFRDRLIFPIADLRGRVIAFGGRALAADVQAKYLNSPETPLFRKGQVLFNGQAARAEARRSHLVVVEGYVDVIACVAAGFGAAVAPLGTALTEDQLRLLWRMADEPILCFDGDEAGLKAAFRAIDVALPLLQPGKSLRFALLPEGRDPDDLIRAEGAGAFQGALEAARPLVDMLWERETRGHALETPERRAGLERALWGAAALIADPTIRKHYELMLRERVAQTFGPPRSRRSEWRGRRDAPLGPSSSLLAHPMVRQSGRGAAVTIRDAILVGGILCHPEIAGERLETFGAQTFDNPDLARLASALTVALSDDPDASFVGLRARLEREGHAAAIGAVLAKLRAAGMVAAGPAGEPGRAARIWDEAAHLRLRAASLSIERRAAALALGRETSDTHLTRFRDIQEQDLRALQVSEDVSGEGTAIIHPFKP